MYRPHHFETIKNIVERWMNFFVLKKRAISSQRSSPSILSLNENYFLLKFALNEGISSCLPQAWMGRDVQYVDNQQYDDLMVD
jgi:hypothetical protein